MKIALPVDENSTTSPVCVSFGRTAFFMIFNTENKNTEFINNTAASSQGGAGIKAAQLLADSGADVLITFRCGENAEQVLTPAGVKLYKAVEGTASFNIQKFQSGELSPLNEIHKGLHNQGDIQ